MHAGGHERGAARRDAEIRDQIILHGRRGADEVIGPGEQDVFLQTLSRRMAPKSGHVRFPAGKVAPFRRKQTFRAQECRLPRPPSARGVRLRTGRGAFAEHGIDVRGRAVACARHGAAQGVAEAELRAERRRAAARRLTRSA